MVFIPAVASGSAGAVGKAAGQTTAKRGPMVCGQWLVARGSWKSASNRLLRLPELLPELLPEPWYELLYEEF